MRIYHLAITLLAIMLIGLAGGCGGTDSPPPTQQPAGYLSNALDWLSAHAVRADSVNWPDVRRQTLTLVPAPQSAADTYPAIKFALAQLGDYGFLLGPGDMTEMPGAGIGVLYPDGVVVSVEDGSQAESAGIRPGDILEKVNGRALVPFNGWYPEKLKSWGVDVGRSLTYTLTVRQAGREPSLEVTVPATKVNQSGNPLVRRLSAPAGELGYVDLPADAGIGSYQSLVHKGIKAADSPALCGWIIDLRRNTGGDIWTMLAAIGPILGEGQVGGFSYPGARRDTWAYRDGKVFWNTDERDEDVIDGGVYRPGRTMPPVAILTSRVTQAAGELLVVAFKGRPSTRSFGEATSGAPVLIDHTALSDGAELIASAAYALDRNGAEYKGPIEPDQPVPVDWALLGTDADPVTTAAVTWLQSQQGCAH